MPTKIELTLEQSQQGVSNDVLVSIEAVEKLKRNVWIKGENKAALPTLTVETGSIHMLSVFTKVNSVKMEILLEPTLNRLLVGSIINLFKGMANMVDSLYKKSLSAFLRSCIAVMLVRMVIDKLGIAGIKNAWYDASQVTDSILETYTR
nr:putative hydrolase/acyltransferase [Tanacetum cinerariifolium]